MSIKNLAKIQPRSAAVMELYRLADFLAQSEFLVADKLIHSCTNTDCKRKGSGRTAKL